MNQTKKQEFQNWLLLLANNYPQLTLSKEHLKAISLFVEKSVGFDWEWGKIFPRIAEREKFFPTAAVIVEYTGGLEPTALEAAKNFVDEATQAFTSGDALNRLGKAKFKLAKQIGFDSFAIRNGTLQPRFMAAVWVDRARRLFEADESNKKIAIGLSTEAPQSHKIGKQWSGAEIEKLAAQKDLNSI